MHGAMPPFPNTPSWRCAQLKHRNKLNFNNNIIINSENFEAYHNVMFSFPPIFSSASCQTK
jgi:hypothetical protein